MAESAPIVVAVVVSVAVHAGLAVALRHVEGAPGDTSHERVVMVDVSLMPRPAMANREAPPPEPALPSPETSSTRPVPKPDQDPAPQIQPEPQPEEEPLRLGIERGREDRQAWQGFEDETPHAARKSEVDQSAMSPQPGPGGETSQPLPPPSAPPVSPDPAPIVPSPAMPLPAEAPAAPSPASPASPAAPAQPDPTPPDGLEAEPVPPLREPEPSATSANAPDLTSASDPPSPAAIEPEPSRLDASEEVPEPQTPAPVEQSPTPDAPAAIEVLDEALEVSMDGLRRVTAEMSPRVSQAWARLWNPPRSAASVGGASAVTPAPRLTAESREAGVPATSSGAAGGGGAPGEVSASETDAASREEPIVVRPGRVGAARGLEVVTARPRWSTTTLLTAVPRNVRVRVTFDRTGRVTSAEFLGEGSGYPDVDEPLLHAIYRWRASGERIARLQPDETLPLVFSVILRD